MHVEEAADPRPIRRRPEQVAFLREELVRHLHARQVAQQHAVGVERSFRVSRGARCVDDDRGIVRRRVERREIRASADQLGMKVDGAGAAAGNGEHRGEVGQAVADRRELGDADLVGDDGLGAAVRQAEFERILAEEGEERHRDQARLPRRDMGDPRLRRLRQKDREPVAAPQAMGAQHIGEAVRELPYVGEGVALLAMALVEEDEGERAAALAIADIDADVVARRDLPAEPPDHLLVARCARQHRLLPPGMIAEGGTAAKRKDILSPVMANPIIVMAGPPEGRVPAIHVLRRSQKRRGCPAQGRARRQGSVDRMHSYSRCAIIPLGRSLAARSRPLRLPA